MCQIIFSDERKRSKCAIAIVVSFRCNNINVFCPLQVITDLESLCVNILLPKTKPILVGVCYRPPTQFNFYKLLEESLETVSPNTEFILLGDFNTDLSNKNMTCSLVKELYNSNMLGFSQLIDCATRVTCQCSSILDLIFVSVPDNVTQSGVLSVGFSDHLVIYCTRKVKKIKLGTHKSIKIRSLKKYDKTMFNEKLLECDFSVIYDLAGVNEAWDTFKSKFLGILNKCAPLKEVRIKQQSEPWVNADLLEMIEQRDHNLKLFRKFKLSEDYKNYLHFRNKVDHKTKYSKSMYFKESVADNKDKPKKLRGLLKDLGSSNKCKTKITNIGLKIKDTICFDKLAVATHFNNFFSSIAENLVKKLPQVRGKFDFKFVSNFYRDKCEVTEELSFKGVSEEKVLHILTSLNSCKATGLDGLPAKFFIDSAESIVGPLAYIVNLSIRSGVFPDDLKRAKIVPIYKKKAKTEPGNYRPVSVLSVISKVLKRVICEQLTDYIEKHYYLYELQSGFRSSYSTDSCLIHLSDHI